MGEGTLLRYQERGKELVLAKVKQEVKEVGYLMKQDD